MEEPTAQELERLLDENDLVIVDFYATWCGPCKTYSPKFSRVAREMKRQFPERKIAFATIDIDRNQEVAKEVRVMSVPTTVALARGKSFFGKPRKLQKLRFSGDRSWPDLVRIMTDLVEQS